MNALQTWLRKLGRPAVFAHRGASRRAPENSLLALRVAAEVGADGVEFDVQRCESGELVVFHDSTLGRCTGAIGAIRETPLSVLRTLTLDRVARDRALEATGERIPTLEEWLRTAASELFLNLEVKCDTLAQTEAATDCVRALEASGWANRAVVSSFHPAALMHIRSSGLPLGALVESGPTWRESLMLGLAAGGTAVHPEHTLVTPVRVRWWHRLGYPVAAWTVDEPDDAERCLDAGADVLISNYPDRIRPITERYARPRSP